jgi:hypothetical protein
MPKLRIVIGGYIGLMPAGGITWDYIQYPLGFKALGHDVYYIEDTRLYPIYQKPGNNWSDASSCIEHLKNVMKHFGLHDRWAYRDEASGKCFGLEEKKIKAICAAADIFINISCSTFMRDEYCAIPIRILIDSDPMFTQIQYESEQMFTPGKPGIKQLINNHNFHFSFGENIGAKDCLIPLSNIRWQPTRQPICLNFWKVSSVPFKAGAAFTTLMNWSAGKKLLYQNRQWGQKQEEFDMVKELPTLLPEITFAMGIGQTGEDETFSKIDLEKSGWKILDPGNIAATWIDYQQFIKSSLAEFSVAKQTYVAANTGWFSCRSACYLAAGRPVVVQETGWSHYIQAGKGAMAFTNTEEAVEAIKTVAADAKKHGIWARQIAEEYFDSDIVLANILHLID